VRAPASLAALLLAAGCVMPPEDFGQKPPPSDPDGGDGGGGGVIVPPSPPAGGGGGGGGPVQIACPARSAATQLPPGALGSGSDGDPGTSMLWLVRIDRGTANTAQPIAELVSQTVDAMKAAGIGVRSLAVASLADGSLVWGTTDLSNVDGGASGLAAALGARAGIDAPPPTSCADDAVVQAAQKAAGIGGPTVLAQGTSAVFVGIVDTGPRPLAIENCPGASRLASDPVSWVLLGPPLRIGQVRYAFFATPESGDVVALRTRCAGLRGFPQAALDAIAPSSVAYFDPLAARIDATCSGVAAHVDLCDAFGSGAGALLSAMATDWARLLVQMR
jgi:hypothetical protein